MLTLDSTEWSKLSHAYGSAVVVPDLLRTLALDVKPKSDFDEEPWFSLWSALCHQSTVYDASYAAVPHIVEIAYNADGPIDAGFFLLPTCIEIARKENHGPDIPEQLKNAYKHAIARLANCVDKHQNGEWNKTMMTSALAAQAVSKGQFREVDIILNSED